jgi:3D (Asp-Asp-Asp) domain-containing protein
MILFIDGCSHYGAYPADYQLLLKWGAASATMRVSSGDASQPLARRSGSDYLYTVQTGQDDYAETVALALTTRAVIGCAVRVVAAGDSGGITFYKGATAQMTLTWDTSQRLNIKRGGRDGTTLASTDPGVVPLTSWFYVEFDGTVHDTAGASEVRFNGSELEDLTLTGQDTKPGSDVGVDRIRFFGRGTICFTDIWVDDADFHGDCIVDTLMPTGAGANTDWTPSAGANYENVDDSNGVDSDSTYNSSSTEGDIDTFAFGNLVSRPTSAILAVAVNLALRKDDATTRVVKPVLRIGSTNYVPATGIALVSAYAVGQRIWELNPAGSEIWEEADVNGAEPGYVQSSVS